MAGNDSYAVTIPWSVWFLKSVGNFFRRRITRDSNNATTFNIDDAPVEHGHMQALTRIVVENETSEYDQLRVGVVSGEVFYPLEEEKAPVDDQLYTLHEDIFLSEGEILRCELKGTTVGDRINLYVEGFEGRKDQL